MALTTNKAYLLDSNIFVAALRKNTIARAVLLEGQKSQFNLGYSAITELELWIGIKGRWTVQEHEQLLDPFRAYPFVSDIARRAGTIRRLVGTNKDTLLDCAIAATAEAYDLILITQNVRDYEDMTRKAGVKFAIESLDQVMSVL